MWQMPEIIHKLPFIILVFSNHCLFENAFCGDVTNYFHHSMQFWKEMIFIYKTYACRRCSNYIFIFYLTPGFNGLGKDNCKTRQETF